ncbi:hypothetical protein MC885_005384 [Smutsia gigantea]|nr:hypothetical protein MC885_005384 [Smutsia gigantea]
MRPGAAGTLKAVLLLLASVCAWYSGYLLAELIPEVSLASAVYSFRSIGDRPVLKAPDPKRQKCDHWTPCPLNTYAYRLLSGGGRDKYAKICFEDELILGEKTGNVARGINIAVVNYMTGKVIATQYFDMYEGDNSGLMTKFIQSVPSKSLLFMVTHDDGSSRLKEDAKRAIQALGSKEIRSMQFRSSWVFLAAKGFELPVGIQREKPASTVRAVIRKAVGQRQPPVPTRIPATFPVMLQPTHPVPSLCPCALIWSSSTDSPGAGQSPSSAQGAPSTPDKRSFHCHCSLNMSHDY